MTVHCTKRTAAEAVYISTNGGPQISIKQMRSTLRSSSIIQRYDPARGRRCTLLASPPPPPPPGPPARGATNPRTAWSGYICGKTVLNPFLHSKAGPGCALQQQTRSRKVRPAPACTGKSGAPGRPASTSAGPPAWWRACPPAPPAPRRPPHLRLASCTRTSWAHED